MNVKSPSSNEHAKSALALAKLNSQLNRIDLATLVDVNLSEKQLVTLSNTYIGRVEKIVGRLREGESFSSASRYRPGEYDTVA